MGNPLCTYSGIFDSVSGFLCNATTGNLSASQAQQIKDQAVKNTITAAGQAGHDPAVQQALADRVKKEIDSVLNTFGLQGESGSDIGASPDQSHTARLPGVGVTSVENLEAFRKKLTYGLLAAGAVVGLFLAFPYIAPFIGQNIRAVQGLRR